MPRSAFLTACCNVYSASLRFVLRHRFVTLVVTILTLVGTMFCFVIVPKGFFPSEDTGQLSITLEAAQDISFESMREHMLAVNAIVTKEVPEK